MAQAALEEADALCTQLREGSSSQREAAYTRLLEIEASAVSSGAPHATGEEQRTASAVAVACARPLCEVLCKAADEVCAEEYRRAACVLTAITGIDPAKVGGAACKIGEEYNVWRAWGSSSSVLSVLLDKPPETLTLEDALTFGCAHAMVIAGWATYRGIDGFLGEASAMEFITQFNENNFLCTPRFPDDKRNLALAPLMLDLLRQPEKLPPFSLVGCIWQTACLVAGRPAVATKMVKHGAVDLYMGLLRRAKPAEQAATAGFSRAGYGEVYHAMRDLLEPAQIAGLDLTGKLLECGFIDETVSMLSAVKDIGYEKANGDVVVFAVWMLKLLDGEALPAIEEMLRTANSALRYLSDAPVTDLEEFGMTASNYTKFIAANLYGRDEENEHAFQFTQKDVDCLVDQEIEWLQPTTWGKIWQLSSNQAKGLLSLCVSDAGKQLLLECSRFVPLLVSGLMLDADHPRKDTSEEIKTKVQRDYAECIQQVSLLPLGCERLGADPSVVQALDLLVEKGWSDGAKDCARGALLQLHPERTRHMIEEDEKHIMMSYNWDNQEIIKRIVAELKSRRYKVWFDVISMQGSIMDAMSEAVEGSELMLYGVSEKYKESANCRLELSYGVRENVAMIPLMMQQDYKAKGWLGLILGQSLWHAFYDSAVDTDAKFKDRMDGLIREIGNRGLPLAYRTENHVGGVDLKENVSEGVPPTLAQEPNPLPALTPAAAALNQATSTQNSRVSQRQQTSTMQQSPPIPMDMQTLARTPDVAEVSAEASSRLLERLVEQQCDLLREQREQAKADRARFELKFEQMRAELAAPTAADALITDEQLGAFQQRVERLGSAKLLTQEEVTVIEDLVADFVEVKISVQDQLITHDMVYTAGAAGKGFGVAKMLHRLIGLSEAMVADSTFVRQARRKTL